MRGVKRGGIGVFAGWALGLVALPCGLRCAASAVGRCLAGVGGRGLRVGPRWPPRGVVLMVQRSDFVRKKIDFSESCTTKRRRTAVGCCKLMDASQGPLQACSPMPCAPAPTGVQALGQAALRSPLPLVHTHRARPRAETGRARRGSGAEGGFSSDRRSGCARGCRGGCARRPAWPRCGGFVGARGRGIGSGF